MTSSRVPLEPMPRKVIALVATGIALVTTGLVILLWWWGTAGLSGKELVTARLDALRTGLSIGIGGGGVFALYLAWRRQHATEVGLVQKELDQADVARTFELQREVAEHNRLHAERVAAATEKDAADRRVTDLYTKASEQLGSDKAPVRFAGIFALERLAQDNPEQRQTIVNLLCAYLRMPYQPPGDEADADHRERVQELEVRRTAQQVLGSHVRLDVGAAFWGEKLDLNLRGATLVALDFRDCLFGEVNFDRAVFVGETDFEGVMCTGRALFNEVVFEDFVHMANVEFADVALFSGAAFHGVGFGSARFRGFALFEDVKFHASGLDLAAETLNGAAHFVSAAFGVGGSFQRASFEAGANFSDVTGGMLHFGGAAFEGVTTFRNASNTDLLCNRSGDVLSQRRMPEAGQHLPTRVSTGDVANRSIWPENWVVGEDGVLTERPVETSVSA